MVNFQFFSFNWAKEAFRILKPGAFLLSFGGTRTYHRMACGIEDAGFEIRDCIMWIYGSGFPKSLNIGKQIDKIQGNEREDLGENPNKRDRTKAEFNSVGNFGNNFRLTKGNSEWEGWGTALKPACEPIILARKPLSEKNVALNVLKWGTGGINIDECRIQNGEIIKVSGDKKQLQKWKEQDGRTEKDKDEIINTPYEHNLGRFPANIILDEEAGEMLDEQSGIQVSRGNRINVQYKNPNKPIIDFGGGIKNDYNDKGGASRFFYCAKASKSERNMGCEELEEKQVDGTNGNKYLGLDSAGIRNPYTKNNHPTVKPIKLIKYLIKLVSKEGAIILDPFLGSGTTAVACKQLNRNFIGIEKEKEYIEIANKRLSQSNLNNFLNT
jgi:site-specific DNA-methyltransferase (adenine-specific)